LPWSADNRRAPAHWAVHADRETFMQAIQPKPWVDASAHIQASSACGDNRFCAAAPRGSRLRQRASGHSATLEPNLTGEHRLHVRPMAGCLAISSSGRALIRFAQTRTDRRVAASPRCGCAVVAMAQRNVRPATGEPRRDVVWAAMGGISQSPISLVAALVRDRGYGASFVRNRRHGSRRRT